MEQNVLLHFFWGHVCVKTGALLNSWTNWLLDELKLNKIYLNGLLSIFIQDQRSLWNGIAIIHKIKTRSSFWTMHLMNIESCCFCRCRRHNVFSNGFPFFLFFFFWTEHLAFSLSILSALKIYFSLFQGKHALFEIQIYTVSHSDQVPRFKATQLGLLTSVSFKTARNMCLGWRAPFSFGLLCHILLLQSNLEYHFYLEAGIFICLNLIHLNSCTFEWK